MAIGRARILDGNDFEEAWSSNPWTHLGALVPIHLGAGGRPSAKKSRCSTLRDFQVCSATLRPGCRVRRATNFDERSSTSRLPGIFQPGTLRRPGCDENNMSRSRSRRFSWEPHRAGCQRRPGNKPPIWSLILDRSKSFVCRSLGAMLAWSQRAGKPRNAEAKGRRGQGAGGPSRRLGWNACPLHALENRGLIWLATPVRTADWPRFCHDFRLLLIP